VIIFNCVETGITGAAIDLLLPLPDHMAGSRDPALTCGILDFVKLTFAFGHVVNSSSRYRGEILAAPGCPSSDLPHVCISEVSHLKVDMASSIRKKSQAPRTRTRRGSTQLRLRVHILNLSATEEVRAIRSRGKNSSRQCTARAFVYLHRSPGSNR
jgi:hypothetical protein